MPAIQLRVDLILEFHHSDLSAAIRGNPLSEEIIDHCDGSLLTITLNRPEHGNGLNDTLIAQLASLLQGAAARARMVLLKAAGDDFCVGRIAPRGAAAPKLEALAARRGRDVIFNCYSAFRESPLPVIAAVQGRALGFGCAIAACADITIAAHDASFQMPEFGENIMPTIAMSALLGKVTAKQLMYVAYSTAVVTAERAEHLGIVSEVAPGRGGLELAVERICAQILKAPQAAVLAIKEFARVAPCMDIHGAIDYARSLHAVINSSSEMRP
ncbi:MAG TPA: enoyl-CoA hydratase/isomerase family protein [Micropepsaceae bacterium]|nr:enoyl-CoA hydratase/isomerase family protein [Micropepsaceae bacterium]